MPSFTIPENVQSFLLYMERQGFQAFLVGGCVRDGLQELSPHDWDVCTNAVPQELKALFPKALTYGMRHGTMTVNWQDLLIEVTTFRSEGTYTDHRRPDRVLFVNDLYTDLARRDFTINAVAMDARGQLHDPWCGLQDLKSRKIRAVGNAETRFQEDALRMLRAIRFSAQLGFEIEAETRDAILQCAPLAAALSAERVAQEIEKTLLTEHPEYVAEMISSGLLKHWISETVQDDPRKLNRISPERIRRWCGLGLLFNNNGFLNILHLDRKVIQACDACFQLRKQTNRDALFWKQAIHQFGKVLPAIAADVLSAWDSSSDDEILHKIVSSGDCCTISELSVRGEDLLELGLNGKMIGEALEKALRYVWKYPDRNEREHILAYLKEEI